ncbi:MAG: YihY/virulence factor BrkB family protein [Reyranella sp.]
MPGLRLRSSLRSIWSLLQDTIEGFVEDDALSRGASIAYYTLFSLAPVLLIAIAIAGLAFGPDAARGAIVAQLSGLMGGKSAEALQAMVESASNPETGMTASIIGVLAALITITGAFGEVQSALNAIWKTRSRRSTLSRLVRARLASLGLVATSGFLLTVSLVVSAALAAVSDYLKVVFPAAEFALQLADIAISATLLTGLFAAIYKVLPDTPIAWRDVAVGALVTAGLFEGGKSVIALYIGKSDVASSYGAAGALIILLLWIFYSAQIFLLGAEFTRAFARRYGSHAGREVSNPIPS